MLDGTQNSTRENERAPGNFKIEVPTAQVPRDIWGEFLMRRAALHYAKHLGPVFPVPPGSRKSHKSAKYSGGEPWGRPAIQNRFVPIERNGPVPTSDCGLA